MRYATIVAAFLASGLLFGRCEAATEFLPGTPCPDGYTCSSAEPRDGVCQHPNVVLDEAIKGTRIWPPAALAAGVKTPQALRA